MSASNDQHRRLHEVSQSHHCCSFCRYVLWKDTTISLAAFVTLLQQAEQRTSRHDRKCRESHLMLNQLLTVSAGLKTTLPLCPMKSKLLLSKQIACVKRSRLCTCIGRDSTSYAPVWLYLLRTPELQARIRELEAEKTSLTGHQSTSAAAAGHR